MNTNSKSNNVDSTAQTNNVESTSSDLSNAVINLQDLRNILVVFDLASTRGAFKGPELEPVGQLYNKIAKFVQAATPPTETPTNSNNVSA